MARGGSRPGGAARRQRALLVAAAALCTLLAQPEPTRASFFFGGGGREEKVPMTVVSSDYSPRPAPLGHSPSAAPAPAPAPMPGSDGEGDEDGTPRLPSERRSPGGRAPSSGDRGAAGAPAGAATSADFISSSPAVPLPAGVTDSATVLLMPTPGLQQQQRQRRDEVGMGALRLQVRAVQLAVPLLMMVSFRALWW
ncbi:unnamed protein product [Urochloa humidicola]